MRITNLWTYPVKSIGGVAVQRAEITAAGSLAGDREWLVVDETGAMLWQRDLPRMALLRADRTSDRLGITNRDGERFEVDVRHGGVARQVTQYRVSFAGIDAGDAAAAMLSGWLGRAVRLVRIGKEAHSWPKLNPVHVIGDGSLAALNERLARGGKHPMEVERFRPNVLLAAANAWEEERREVIDFGLASLWLREPSIRCVLPSIDRRNARVERELLRPIATMSRERSTALTGSFGVYSSARGHYLECGMTAD